VQNAAGHERREKKRKHCSSHGKVERLIWIKVVALNGRIE